MRLNMDDAEDVDINMGPMIDCVFLLLIFFLVSTTMKTPEDEMQVALPEPAISAQPNVDRKVQTLAIDNQGVFYWGATPVGQSELHRRIAELGSSNPEQHLRIDVDREAPSRFLVQAMDLCRYEGLKNYAIHTQSDKDRRKWKPSQGTK